jgi:hypothetical protein
VTGRKGVTVATISVWAGLMSVLYAADPVSPAQRPGRIHLGPLYLTPELRLGAIGVDTNVFYTPTDRRVDFRASGGPGLKAVLPLPGGLQVIGSAGVTYQYYMRTTQFRRFMGDYTGGLAWVRPGARTQITIDAGRAETFGRAAADVDRQVGEERRFARVAIQRMMSSRTAANIGGGAERIDVTDPLGGFRGADLRAALSRDAYTANGGLGYRLTAKTSLTVEGAVGHDDFRFDPTRDADHGVVSAGIRTTSTTLLSGQILLGYTQHRPVDRTIHAEDWFYTNANVTWHITPRTDLGGGYLRDLTYSTFATLSGAPVLRRETILVNARREIVRRLDLQLEGQRQSSVTANPTRFQNAAGETLEATRRDILYSARADLGYRIGSRLRLGVTAAYDDRSSNFADLGVHGLLLGGTATFTP